MASEQIRLDEVWLPIAGYEDRYEVSSHGAIRRKDGKIMSTKSKNAGGYPQVGLSRNGKSSNKVVHRIVAAAFHGMPEGLEVNHKNGIKTDNRAENLEWVTHSENILHGYYMLGNQIKPIIAEPVGGGTTLRFESIERAVAAGHHSGSIYKCLSGRLKKHHGYRWRRPDGYAPDLGGGK